MENFLFYILLYYILMLSILLITIRKYYSINYLLLFIFLTLYMLSFILSLIGFINDVNIIDIDTKTINYLDELDFTVEIPEGIDIDYHKKVWYDGNSLGSKFLNLFNNDSYYIDLDIKFKNSHYINYSNNIRNTFEWYKINACYKQISDYNKEISTFINSCIDILNDLESIQKNLDNGIKV